LPSVRPAHRHLPDHRLPHRAAPRRGLFRSVLCGLFVSTLAEISLFAGFTRCRSNCSS
jgi:hypothetical protein